MNTSPDILKTVAKYAADRRNGKTYQQIADENGVSKQAVQDLMQRHGYTGFKYYGAKHCIYPNLRKWLNDTKTSRKALANLLGLAPISNITIISGYLTGKNFPAKPRIDRLIEITGLTYEQLFSEEERDEEA